jgi:hypothetical protein
MKKTKLAILTPNDIRRVGGEVKYIASLPKYSFNDRAQNPHMVIGYLYAQRLSI